MEKRTGHGWIATYSKSQNTSTPQASRLYHTPVLPSNQGCFCFVSFQGHDSRGGRTAWGGEQEPVLWVCCWSW